MEMCLILARELSVWPTCKDRIVNVKLINFFNSEKMMIKIAKLSFWNMDQGFEGSWKLTYRSSHIKMGLVEKNLSNLFVVNSFKLL